MRLDADWIRHDDTQAVMAMLCDAGHKAYFVGGCIRNTLMGMPVKDIDIATDAHPERVMQLASAHGLHAVPTGLEHGTVTVIAGGIAHEVTTFRRDVETLGRKAVVAYSDTVLEDALRRDFTMNALYADAGGEVLDPLHGIEDLRARHVRFIEDAGRRIEEDYLRILRFFRFHAWYGDPEAGMDQEALAAIAAHVDGIDHLSKERVGAEILRLLAAPDPSPSVAAMRACGALMRVLPGADDRVFAPLVHLESQYHLVPDAILRLTALGGDDPVNRLRLSRGDARKLETMQAEAGSEVPALELGYRHGVDTGRAILLLRAAMFDTPEVVAEWRAVDRGARARFPIRAADLMPGLNGPALGARLRDLEARWLESDCRLTREALLQEAQRDD